ncbi:endonuclease/exonuclease/phosphatase family protein [Rhizobium ruizarguesonis]
MKIVGINMQGSNVGTGQSKFVGVISQFFLDREVAADIVCIQEAGPSPTTGGSFTAYNPANYPPWLGGVAPFPLAPMFIGSWKIGTAPLIVKVFWLQTDPGGNRCNLCICLRDDIPTPHLIYIPGAGAASSRGAIGFEVTLPGGVTRRIYTLHALSGGGADAPAVMAGIAVAPLIPGAAAAPPWIAVGDYNRAPTAWPVPPPGTICPPNGATLPSYGSILDYAICSPGLGPATVVVQPAGSVSDHQYIVCNV